MTAVTADNSRLLKDLQLFQEPVEVLDVAGNLVGLFVPADLGVKFEVASEDERRQAEAMMGKEERYPSEQVLDRLKQLEQEFERRRLNGQPELTTEEALAFIDRLR